MLNLIVAHGTYHTLKMQYLQNLLVAEASNDWEPLYDLARIFATNLAREWASLNGGLRPLKPCDTEC